MKSISTPSASASASDSGSSQFELIDSENLKDVPDTNNLSLAYRASMQARIGGDLNDIKSLKQKNKALKDAVLKERELKSEVEKKLKDLKEKQSATLRQIEEKEEKLMTQGQQIQQLKESLLQERNTSTKYLDLYQKLKTQVQMTNGGNQSSGSLNGNESDSFFQGFTQIIGLSSNANANNNNSKMQSEQIVNLQKENCNLLEQSSKFKSEISTLQFKLKNEMDPLTEKLVQANKTLEELRQKIKSSENDLIREKNEKERIRNVLEQKCQEIELLRDSMQALEQKSVQNQQKQQQMDQQLLQHINETEQRKKEVISAKSKFAALESEKANLEKQVATIEDKIMMFTLKKLNGSSYDNCQIICRKDIEGQHIIEFDTVKERYLLNVLDIQDVICEYDPEPLLHVTLNKAIALRFSASSSEMKIVEKKLRQFVQSAPSYKSTTRSINQKDQKGFVDNIYSFFK